MDQNAFIESRNTDRYTAEVTIKKTMGLSSFLFVLLTLFSTLLILVVEYSVLEISCHPHEAMR